MHKKQLVPVAISALLVVNPLAMAEEAHHPDQPVQDTASVSMPIVPAAEASGTAADPNLAPMQAPGMMQPGMSWQGGSGTMMPGMMGGMQGMQGMQGMAGGPGGGMMVGRPGMMGCMQGMGGGMMGKGGMMQKHQDVVNRLDLLDARLAKIEIFLERLMQR